MNVALVSTNNGPIATNYTYLLFGATTVDGSASSNSYEFTGRENDGTGLYLYRARYYQPTLQRFISQDPIRFRGGDANLYAYVENAPVNRVDPLGLWTFQIGLGGSITGGDGVIGGGGTGSFGLIFDGQGNVGFYTSIGGSLGTGNGFSASAGIDVQWSNGGCIKDVRGLFFETIGSVEGVSGDAFGGQGSQNQLVLGGGGVFGVGEGVGGQGAATTTTVTPFGNISNEF